MMMVGAETPLLGGKGTIMNKVLLRVDHNGTKYWAETVSCPRCGGKGGSEVWNMTGYTCYQCGGSGVVTQETKEYTPEHQAKLDAQRAKRQAKKKAEIEARQAEWEAREKAEEEKRLAEEARIKAEKAISQYVGEIGEKIEIEVTYTGSAHWTQHFGYMEQTMYCHRFKDASGNVLVWKTQSFLGLDDGQKILLRGTIKDHSEYRDEKQTALLRCKVVKVIETEIVPEETEEDIAKKQRASLSDLDFIWRMPYKQYKDHYSDCETVKGSYDHGTASIEVIIRDGRLKNSGVRGQHFNGYEFKDQNGLKYCYQGVCAENVYNRLSKEYPDKQFEFTNKY